MNSHEEPTADAEPIWRQAIRSAAVQRPRTQFVKIRWALLQTLLRERDAVWAAASPDTRAIVTAMRQAGDYACKRPRGMYRAMGRPGHKGWARVSYAAYVTG